MFSLSGKMNIQIPRFYIFPVPWQPCSLIFTARKRSFRQGNVFTGVCLSTGGRDLCMMLLPVLLTGPMFLLGGLSLVPCSFGGCLCLGDQGGLCLGVYVQGYLLAERRGFVSGRSPHTVTSGWYASYWNAFL